MFPFGASVRVAFFLKATWRLAFVHWSTEFSKELSFEFRRISNFFFGKIWLFIVNFCLWVCLHSCRKLTSKAELFFSCKLRCRCRFGSCCRWWWIVGRGSRKLLYFALNSNQVPRRKVSLAHTICKLNLPKHLLWLVARSMNTFELMTFPNGINICMSSASPNSWGKW